MCWTKAELADLRFLVDMKQHPGRRMTEAEFVKWCTRKTRAEWVDGRVVVLRPDTVDEDRMTICGMLMRFIADECDVGTVLRNFHVRFNALRTRRAPDFLFVARRRTKILKSDVCDGAPDLILEIVSQESAVRDIREKFFEYQKAGVQEYWLAIPALRSFIAYALGDDKKYRELKAIRGKLRSKVLKGFYLNCDWIERDKKFPSLPDILREMKLVK